MTMERGGTSDDIPSCASSRTPTAADAAMARASLEATIACLDALCLDQIAAHASLALERLNEQFPPFGDGFGAPQNEESVRR